MKARRGRAWLKARVWRKGEVWRPRPSTGRRIKCAMLADMGWGWRQAEGAVGW